MFTLTTEQQARFNTLARPYFDDPCVRRMQDYIQHGTVTTYAHVVRVAQASFALASRLNLKVDYEALVTAALLHDFYLYDWHDRSTSKPNHATKHPLYAAENARTLMGVSPRVEAMIRTHMWPLPPTRVPASKEAWVICAADKWCALTETVTMRRREKGADAPC